MDTGPDHAADPLETRREAAEQPDAPHEAPAQNGDEAIQVSSPGAEVQDTASSVNPPCETKVECGCISPTQDHLENLRTWRQDINGALSKLPAIDIQYTRVVVLMVYWAMSDVSHLKTHADELRRVFSEKYGYEVEAHILDNKQRSQKDSVDIYNDFRKKLGEVIEKVNVKGQSNLLILYYAGHGATLDGKKPEETLAPYVWQPTQTAPTHRLQFRQCQPILMNMRADILFLFDCCYALAMIEEGEFQTWAQRSEILCSSSALEQASALKSSSFTKALAEELKKRSDQRGQGANWYYTLLTSTERTRNHKLVQAPLWRRYSSVSFQTGIFLQSQKWTPPQISGAGSLPDDDSAIGSSNASIMSQDKLFKRTIDELSNLSDLRVLVKIRLRNPVEQLLMRDWMEMFEHRPANVDTIEVNVVDKVVCHALFESDSSLLLVTVPIWLWQTVEHNAAYENLGIVRSDNLLAPGQAVGMMKVATDIASSAKLKQTAAPLDKSKQSVFETISAKEDAAILAEQRLVEHEEDEELAEMKPKDIEKDILEKEDIVRRREQELSEREQQLRIKEEKVEELEQRENAVEERSKMLEQRNNAVEEKERRHEDSVRQKNQELTEREQQLKIREEKAKELEQRTNAVEEKERRHEDSVRRKNQELTEREQQLKIREEKAKELANALEDRERKHEESVLLTERRLAERERDVEGRERRIQRTLNRNVIDSGKPEISVPHAIPTFGKALSAINDAVSPDPSYWRGWGRWVMNSTNESFLGLAERTTQQVSRRQERRILTGAGMRK
jgi:hypothetical protein